MKHEENKTYELIPLEDHEQDWGIRILEGTYNETVIKYGAITFNEDDENIPDDQASMSFEFTVMSSPDEDLTSEDPDLQQFCGKLLEAIIIRAIEKEELEAVEREK